MIRRANEPQSARHIIARVIFGAALITVLMFALAPEPAKIPIDNWGDKLKHFLAFLALSILCMEAFPKVSLARIGERLCFLGALIELVQSIPALYRDCDILDWLTDTIAVLTVLLVATAFRRDRRTH